MRRDRIDLLPIGDEDARIVERRRRVLLALLVLATVAAVAIVGLTKLDVGRASGHLPAVVASGPTVPAAVTRFTVRPVPGPVPRVRTYRVRTGDTLAAIATRAGVSVTAIAKHNGLTSPDRIAVGQALVIPAPTVLRVAVGAVSESGVQLRLTVRAEPREQIVFTVRTPAGTTNGAPHPADPDGLVRATYDATPASARYEISARGDRGTTAAATFDLVAP